MYSFSAYTCGHRSKQKDWNVTSDMNQRGMSFYVDISWLILFSSSRESTLRKSALATLFTIT